jgi:L-aspartate oxidase
MDVIKSDILVIGGGIAGCTAALKAATNGLSVVLITKEDNPVECNSYYAQGGIVYEGEDDSTRKLKDDILKTGDGVSYPPAVNVLVNEGPRLVKELLIDQASVPFNRDSGGKLDFTEEAAHSARRIIHVDDYTGQAIESALMKLVEENSKISIYTERVAIDLLTEHKHTDDLLTVYEDPTCMGAYVFDVEEKKVDAFIAKATVLAAGGLSRIFLYTTNINGATGDGFAMAHRAEAQLINMEYVQFHPTAFRYDDSKCFLISESLRGEGAVLKTPEGKEFMEKYHPDGSLAPRDIVSRAIHNEMFERKYPHVLLDIASYMKADKIKERFPKIHSTCLDKGLDISTKPIPVVPAAHYACGGVKVDLWGRTNVKRLYAIGEVSCTGVHGANRLASTSMLECLVWGDRAVRKILDDKSFNLNYKPPKVKEWVYTGVEEPDIALINQDINVIRYLMWNYVGLDRTIDRLKRAYEDLQHLQQDIEEFYRFTKLTRELIELRHVIQTALLVEHAAWRNKRSLGSHFRRS